MKNEERFKKALSELLDWRLCHRGKENRKKFEKKLDNLYKVHGVRSI